MRLGFARLVLGALAAALWFSACGGNTGRRPQGDAEAGEPGAGAGGSRGGSGSGGASTGGSAPIPADAGAPITGLAGAEGLPEGGRGAIAGAPTTGDAGQPPQQGGETGVAGAPQTGAGGEALGVAGVGGAGGAPLECCTPLGCDDLPGGAECTSNYREDGCGKTFICKCEPGSVCLDGQCADCDPGPDECAGGFKCGPHLDSCGNSIQCPDDCTNVVGALGVCYAGYCCSPSKTECAPGDCGYMQNGCGGFIDCTDQACQDGTCQLNGRCCTPSVACTATDCGYIDDGCGNYLDCGNPCEKNAVCLDNACVTSMCKAREIECDHVYNPHAGGFEYCGTCPQGVACKNFLCVPFCE